MDSIELDEYDDLTSPRGKIAIEIKVSSCQSSNIEKIQERYVDQGWINTTTQPIGMGLPHAASFSFQNFILQTLAKNVLDPSTGDLEIRVFENDRTSYKSLYADKDILKIWSQYFAASTLSDFFRLMDQKLAPTGTARRRREDG
jgi:hypothetical protein